MGVAALSTSAIALTASPAPTPAVPQAAEAPQAFAKLVARAKPDDKAQQDGARSETAPDAESETAVVADDTAKPASDEEVKDKSAAKPADLLSEIEAMLAAASQLGVSQPVAAPVVAAPVTTALPATAEVKTEAAIATPIAPAPTAPALPIATAPVAIEAEAATQAPIVQPIAKPTVDAPTAQPVAEPAVEALTDTPAQAPRADLAALLGALKSAVEKSEGQDNAPVAASPNPAARPVAEAPAAKPVPVAVAPEAPVAAKDAPADAAIVAAIMTAQAEVAAPKAVKADAVVVAANDGGTADPAVDAALKPAAVPAAAKPRHDAPVAAAVAPRPEFVAAAPLPDGAIAANDIVAAPADDAALPAIDAPTDSAAAPAADVETAAVLPTPLPVATTSAATPLNADNDVGAPSHAEMSIDRHLDLARDNQWLDRLARDISQAATQQGHLKFQLNPEHLGALTIEIANSASGTAIRMTAETDQARNIIADAQPRLLAEVRAQGLRVAESHVDLNQQQSGGGSASAQGQQQQQSSADHKPFARTQAVVREDAVDSAPSEDDGELYA